MSEVTFNCRIVIADGHPYVVYARSGNHYHSFTARYAVSIDMKNNKCTVSEIALQMAQQAPEELPLSRLVQNFVYSFSATSFSCDEKSGWQELFEKHDKSKVVTE
ncbi:MAG: hypothetical protein H6779_00920 [Candidatus Nomurabacteria bacterium]|nr:hypothetical protein [Candidatus Nomurabacteria bacterium]USN87992.1 MAG: hypothetical protein H6779_00920 [Candidatus Nomurabacteria bacterium]